MYAMTRKKVNIDDESYGGFKIFDLVEELKKIFDEADEMAKDGLTPKQVHRFLKVKGIEIETV